MGNLNIHMQKSRFGSLTQYTKIKSERITNINIELITLKTLEGFKHINSHELRTVKDFLGMTPKVKATKQNINNLDFISI